MALLIGAGVWKHLRGAGADGCCRATLLLAGRVGKYAVFRLAVDVVSLRSGSIL